MVIDIDLVQITIQSEIANIGRKEDILGMRFSLTSAAYDGC
jgi:hypothetical protein